MILSNKILVTIGVALLLIALPITIFLVRQQQTLRSRASGQVNFFLSPASGQHHFNENFDVDIMINSGSYNIGAVDINVIFDKDRLQVSSFTPSENWNQVILTASPNNTNGTFRFAAGNNTTTALIGNVRVGTIHFTTKTLLGSAAVQVAGNDVGAKTDPPTDLTSDLGQGNYNIVQDSVTPSPSQTSSNPVAFHLTPQTSTQPVGQNLDVQVSLNGGSYNIGAVDFGLDFNNYRNTIQLDSANPFTPSNNFNQVIQNSYNNSNGTFRFAAGNNTATVLTGNIIVGTLHFKGLTAGTAQVFLTSNDVGAKTDPPTDIPGVGTSGTYNFTFVSASPSLIPGGGPQGLTVSGLPSCISGSLSPSQKQAANLTWTPMGSGSTFWVDISTSNGFNSYYHKFVSGFQTNLTGLNLINVNPAQEVNIVPSTTYYVRVTDATNNLSGNSIQLFFNSCTVLPSPTPPINPGAATFGLNPSSGEHQTNEAFDVGLVINMGQNNLSFVDTRVTYPANLLQIDSFTPTTTLNSVVTNGPPNNDTGTFRYAAGNNSTNIVTGNVTLGTIHFRAKNQATTQGAQVQVVGNEVTIKNNSASSDIQSNNGLGIYTISSGVTSTCQYQSTQVKFRQNSTQNWSSAGSISANQPVFIAGFHNNDTSTLPNDVALSVQDPNFNAVSVSAGNNISFTPTQVGTYIVRANTNGQSGTACIGQLSLSINTTPPSPSPSPAPRTTVSYRLAESISALNAAPWLPYATDPIETTFQFANTIPGAKQVCDQFKASDGTLSSPECVTLTLVNEPTITGCNLNFDPKGNVSFTILGQNFGTAIGKITVAGNIGSGNNLQWTDTEVTTQSFSGVPSGRNFPVTLTTAQGVNVTGVCSPVSQLALTARLFCPQVAPADLPNVELTLAEGVAGGKIYKQKVTLGKDGVVNGLSTRLVEGRPYIVGIKVPKGVRKNVQFTAARDTTNVDITPSRTNRLALGDVFPLDGGDGVINSADKSEMNREWLVVGIKEASSSGRQSDLNNDKLVNSFDWSCMRQDFNSEDDPEPVAGPIAASPNPNGSNNPVTIIESSSNPTSSFNPTPSLVPLSSNPPCVGTLNRANPNGSPCPISTSVGGFSVNCSGAPNPAKAGQTVTWTATVAGGSGNYSYSWSGASPVGASNTATGVYTPQHQITTVIVTDNSTNQKITNSCSVEIVP